MQRESAIMSQEGVQKCSPHHRSSSTSAEIRSPASTRAPLRRPTSHLVCAPLCGVAGQTSAPRVLHVEQTQRAASTDERRGCSAASASHDSAQPAHTDSDTRRIPASHSGARSGNGTCTSNVNIVVPWQRHITHWTWPSLPRLPPKEQGARNRGHLPKRLAQPQAPSSCGRRPDSTMAAWPFSSGQPPMVVMGLLVVAAISCMPA